MRQSQGRQKQKYQDRTVQPQSQPTDTCLNFVQFIKPFKEFLQHFPD
jgi:hypothetical protein